MPKAALRLALLLGLILVVAACERRAEPFMAIAGPKDVRCFAVRSRDGETLWAFEAEQGRVVTRIDYGVLPEGFAQVVPADGSKPRLLLIPEEIETETLTASRSITHRGIALSSNRIQIYHSEMRLLDRAQAPTDSSD